MPATHDVRIPDREYWREMICCQHACPVGTDARGYVRAITERGLLQGDRNTLRTTNPQVFVAGDAAHGTRLMIDAIARGKKAARSIYLSIYLSITGRDLAPEQIEAHLVLDPYGREKGYEAVPRHAIPAAAVEERIGKIDFPVETGYGPEDPAGSVAGSFMSVGSTPWFRIARTVPRGRGTRCSRTHWRTPGCISTPG